MLLLLEMNFGMFGIFQLFELIWKMVNYFHTTLDGSCSYNAFVSLQSSIQTYLHLVTIY